MRRKERAERRSSSPVLSTRTTASPFTGHVKDVPVARAAHPEISARVKLHAVSDVVAVAVVSIHHCGCGAHPPSEPALNN